MLKYIDRFRHDRRQRLVLGSVLLVLALVVSLIVYWQLRYTGITMTNETYCGYEEHVHTDECYEYTLICTLEETEGHTHDDSCYEEQQALVCGLEESEGHTHDESCYDEEGNLICALEESEGHTHDESCYETQLALICGLEETEAHTHTDDCYEKTLICVLEEHTHTVECLVDLTADIEDASVWEATIPALTYDLRTDIVNIAYSQLGYTESAANYTLADDGTTHMGYTRYGAWYGGTYYGSEYSDWDSMFVAFCLDYAVIADDFTYNSGAYAWSIDLTNSGYYQTADSYSPVVGDVVFIDNDFDGRADVTAIVIFIDETNQTITVIQGNYTITNSEGSSTDTVALVSYSTATETATEPEIVTVSSNAENTEAEVTPAILGYANVTYTAESEPEEMTETVDETESDPEEEVIVEEEAVEVEDEPTEELTEETASEEETETGETEAGEAEAEETEAEEGTLLLTSTATDYVTQVTELYTYALTLTSADTATAESVWTQLMAIWEQIYAEEEAGTLTLTTEEYDKVNTLTDEVYYYFVETVGYDPYGVSTLEEAATANFTSDANVTWDYDKVTFSDGTFTIDFDVNFTDLTKDEIANAGYTYTLSLPDKVEVPDNAVNVTVNGTVNGYLGIPFTYTIKKATDGSYYMEIVFDQTYVNGLASDAVLSGYMEFEATCSAKDVTTDQSGNIVIGSGAATISIDPSSVETSENENWQADVTVTKAAANYDASSKSITYTVVIYSRNGTTNGVTLSDLVELYGNSGDVDMEIKSVKVDSVTYYPEYYSYGYGGDYKVLVVDSDYTCDYTVSTDGDELDLTVSLPKLYGTDSTYSWIIGDCYVIKYTVYIDPDSAEYDSSIVNTATSSSITDNGTVYNSVTVTKTATGHSATKTGSYDSTTNQITWTITLNATGADIAGYTLTDASFADVINGLTVKNSNGADTTNDYAITYGKDSQGYDVIESITFTGTDTDGDNDSTTNTNTYTITYVVSTDSSLGGAAYNETNTVKITDATGGEVSEITGQTYVKNNGSMVKEFVSASDVSDDKTRVISWDTEIYVPVGGISKDTTLVDYLGTWGGDYSSYTSTDTTKQWFTYEQIIELFKGLAYNGITVGSSKIDYNSAANFTLSAYSVTSGGWLTYEELIADNTHVEDVFTAYTITFNNDFDVTGEIKLEYKTTVDVSTVLSGSVTSKSYYNSVKIGSLNSNANYTEYKTVYKMDGNWKEGDTKTSISSDGYLTWIVKVYIPAGSKDDYVITDTLQTGLSFISADLALGYDSATLTATGSGDDSLTAYWASNTTSDGINATIATETGTSGSYEVMTITLDSTDYSWLTSGGGYVTITYTAKIDDFNSSNLSNYTNTSIDADGNTVYSIGSFTNKVEVTWDGNSDSDEQTQDVTYTEKVDSGGTSNTSHDTVIKGGTYTETNGVITYKVALNIDAEDLNNGNVMTFTDVAFSYVGSGYGTYMNLVNGSVKFYELHKLYKDDTSGYYYYLDSDDNRVYVTDSGGNYVSSIASDDSNYYSVTESDSSVTYYYKTAMSLAWTYDQTESWGSYYHTITSTVIPDSTAILVEYQYSVQTASGEKEQMNVSNTATLTGDSEQEGQDTGRNNETWSEPSQSAGLTTDGGITLIKAEKGNYSITIPNTKFALYYWDSTKNVWVQVTQADYGKYYPTGETTTSDTDASKNPMDSDNLFTTGSDGSLTISKNYTDSNNNNKVLGTYSWYKAWTLYKIVEVEAAEGYMLSTEPIYIYWSEYDSNNNATGALVYPEVLGIYSWNIDVTDLGITPYEMYVDNEPITSFTLTKVSNSDGDTIPDATFALYEYEGINASTQEEIWKKIGTYKTDASGKIVITYDEDSFDLNRAYKITEVTTAAGYNIGWEDETEFYFYWSSDDTTANPEALPTNWGVSGTYATVYDLSSGSASVTATNTETSTTIEVTKVWIGTDGEEITNTSSYSAEVQLYYYLTDDQGNVYTVTNSVATQTSTTSTATELVTLTTTTGTVSDTTITLFSRTSGSITIDSYNAYIWTTVVGGNTVTDRTNFLSALFSGYEEAYVEFSVTGANEASHWQLIIQGNEDTKNYGGTNRNDNNELSGYDSLISITGNLYSSDSNTYVIRYSVSDILTALSNSTIVQNYMTTNKCDLETAVKALFNSAILSTSSSSEYGATITSFELVASAATLRQPSTINYDNSSQWHTIDWQSSASYLSQNGAVIALTYDCTTSGVVNIGIQFDTDSDGSGDESYYTSVTIPTGSGTIYVPVSALTNNGSSIPSTYWNLGYYLQMYMSNYSSDFAGTLGSYSILIPASSETTEQTYVKALTVDGTDYRSDGKTEQLTNGWTVYLYRTWGDDSELLSLVQTEGAVIYIEYESTTAPTGYDVGVQSANSGSASFSSASFSAGSNVMVLPLSEISQTIIDDWNCLYMQIYNGDVTIKSVSILTPYTVTESISGVIASDASYAVTLYHPTLHGTVDDNGVYSGAFGSIAISHDGNSNSTTWNAISNSASEPEYDYSDVNDTNSNLATYGANYFTGYAFLDAIYSDLDSNVVITLTNVSEPSVLESIQLLIQGDKSFSYNTMAGVYPTVSSGTDSSGNTVYYLTYSSADIRQQLANNSYTNAAAVFADYNALVLAIGGSTKFEATVTDLQVVTSTELVAENTYLKSSLIGVATGAGVPYTDGTGTSYVYTLNSSNDFTVAVANLPLTLDVTVNGETVTLNRNYYFLETSYSGGTTAFTTTYSQTEGENGGGEIVISNLATSYVLPETGISIDYSRMYEFGVMLILLSLLGARAYRNISRIRKSLVTDPLRDKVSDEQHDESVPDVRTRKFEIPRIVRKGDTRAGPDEAG